jgi:hypothetical protein
MSQTGWVDERGVVVPFEEALEIAKTEGTWAGFPYEILHGMWTNTTKERPDAISVTQLLGCPRKVFLEGKTDWAVPPQDNYAAFRGMVVHSVLEGAGEGTTVEERIIREHRGVQISGQPDSVRVIGLGGDRKLLRDWKTKNKLPMFDMAYTAHMQQVNLYRWLLGLDPDKTDLEIVYISMEGVKIIPLKRGGYTPRSGRAIPNQIWTDEEVEAFLDKHLMVLNAQRKFDSPVAYMNVDEEDLWQCDYCPVRQLCYSRAADEAKTAWENGETVTRVPPRTRKKKGK